MSKTTRSLTGLIDSKGCRICEGDFVLMHWGGERYRIHQVTFLQEGNSITWLLGSADGKHVYNHWTGKDVRVVNATKARSLWEQGKEVSDQMKPLPSHPMDKLFEEMIERAIAETLADLKKCFKEGALYE